MNDNTSVVPELKNTTMQTEQIVFKDITLKNAKLLFPEGGKKLSQFLFMLGHFQMESIWSNVVDCKEIK